MRFGLVNLAQAAALALAFGLAAGGGCGGGGGGSGEADVVAPPDVPAPPDESAPPDVPEDVPPIPDVPTGCPDDTIFVPALDECYPLAGLPDTACVPGHAFVLSFSAAPAWAVDDAPAPVVEWAALAGTVTATEPGVVHVTLLDGDVARFAWSNHTIFGIPWAVGDAVQIEWIGADNPYEPLSPRHGLKVMDPFGRLVFLVDDGKGDLEDPIWSHAPAGGGLEGFTVTREPAGCPVVDDAPGRAGEPTLPMALRVAHDTTPEGEALVLLPGQEGLLTVEGQVHSVRNALAERRVGEENAGRQRMGWLVIARRPRPQPGQLGGTCQIPADCQEGQCADWPGGARICL
jgi:hypothetical protein